MTKLMEWLSVTALLLAVWASIILGYVHSCCLEKWMQVIIPLPLIALGAFGIYAASVVLYRVFTFNDCEDAAKELQNQIIEAREDLKQKGYIFE